MQYSCIYCYARPTHAYMGLSPGIDFESQLFAKPNAAALLRKELCASTYRAQPIALGTNTDPYQPIERQQRITRQILEVMLDTRHPCTITTKSNLILRDLDLIVELAKLNLVTVAISITTLDPKIARAMEPCAPTPNRRMEALRKLSESGVPTMVMVAPIVPSLTDHEMEAILEMAAKARVRRAGYVILRMPLEIKDLIREWLEENTPDRAKRVISLLQSMRGGKDYDAQWGKRMRGEGAYADMLSSRFNLTVKKLGLNSSMQPLDLSQFKPSQKNEHQLQLF